MDMTQFAGSESKYLKAADLNGKATKVFIESVNLVEFETDDGKGVVCMTTKPCLSLVGKEKAVVCNPTSVMELGTAYGFDDDNWVGKEIKLSTKDYPTLGKAGLIITAIGGSQDMIEDEIPF